MVDVSALATETTLSELKTTVDDISLQLLTPARSWAEVDFNLQSSDIVQGPGKWQLPQSGEDGWQYLNNVIGGATLYFYSNTPLVANNFGLESDVTLGSLTTMWFIGNFRALTANNPNRKFYLSVYTKPTGTNDFQPWFHSSKVWQLPTSAKTSKGVDSFYYSELDLSTIYKEYDHIQYELALSNGECGPNEVIQFMALSVDSQTPANNFDGIVKYAGFSTAGGTNRVIKFTNLSDKKLADENLTKLTVTDGNLQVNIMNDVTLASGSEVEVSNMVDVSALATESTLSTLSTLVSTQSAYDRFQTEAVVTDVKLDTIISNMSLTNFNVNNLTKCDTDNVAIPAGVNVNNFPSSFEVSNFPSSTEVSNFPTSTEVSNFPAKQSVFVENTAEGFDLNVNVTNASLAITTASALDTNITNTSLDVHAYASSNGSTWHHLKSDATGHLIVHAEARDGNNNRITSTEDGTRRGLDVAVIGTATISGSVTASANQYGSYGNLANNVASLLSGGVTSGLNVSAWSYFVGAYEDSNGATVGTISLEYSFDNITYYTLFNTQISPSGSSPRRANINKQDIPAVNWIRLRNGTTSTLTSLTVTLLGGSVS